MVFAHSLLSSKTLRSWLAWPVIVALIARGLIPAGYMPDIRHTADQPFAMTACSGMDMSSMAMDTPKEGRNNSSHKLHDRAPCPFGINAVFAFGSVDHNIVAPEYILFATLALTAFVFAQRRSFGNVAPRAPPLVS